MDRHSHHNDQITKAVNVTTTDSATSSGVIRARDRTRIRIKTITEMQGQHARACPLATTTPWTRPLPSIRPPPKKIKKNIARPADASSAVSKATSRGPVQVRNRAKVRTPAPSPSKMTNPTTCRLTVAVIRASRPPHSPHSRCACLTKKKERSPASFKKWEPTWVFRMPERLGSRSGYRYRLCVFS